MANFTAVTSSNGIQLTNAQYSKVQKLFEKYRISMEDCDTGDQGHWGFWGYDWLDVVSAKEEEEQNYDSLLDDFLNELSRILGKKQTLIIQCVGNEKCRFPLAAMQITVTKGKVDYNNPW